MALADFVSAAMSKAVYKEMPDGTFEASVPQLSGAIGRGKTREECETELLKYVEHWIKRTMGTLHQ